MAARRVPPTVPRWEQRSRVISRETRAQASTGVMDPRRFVTASRRTHRTGNPTIPGDRASQVARSRQDHLPSPTRRLGRKLTGEPTNRLLRKRRAPPSRGSPRIAVRPITRWPGRLWTASPRYEQFPIILPDRMTDPLRTSDPLWNHPTGQRGMRAQIRAIVPWKPVAKAPRGSQCPPPPIHPTVRGSRAPSDPCAAGTSSRPRRPGILACRAGSREDRWESWRN